MAKRKLSERQKQYIIDNIETKSISDLSKHLNISSKEVEEVISEFKSRKKETPSVELPEIPKIKISPLWANILLAVGFIGLFIFGFYFRMYPDIKQDFYLLDYDYAFHLSMTREVIEHGKIPETDPKAWYPDGKPVRELLPVILYYLGAGFYPIFKIFSDGSLQDSLVVFYGILGSLTFIPIFFIVYILTRKKHIAFIGSALAALMPSHLVRTFCTRYRYEGPGVLFLLINMVFFLLALNSKTKKKFYTYSILSALFMILSVGTWRVSLLFPALYCITFILLVIIRRTNARLMGAFAIQCIGVTLCFFWYTFLNSQHYAFSHNALLVISLGLLAMGTRWWKHDLEDSVKVDPLLFFIPFFILLIVPMFKLSSGYESFLNILWLKLRFSFGHPRITGIQNILFLNTAELTSSSVWKMFKWDMCSWSAVLVFLYPISLIFFRKKGEKFHIGEILIAVFFFTIFFLTLLFYRNKVLLALFLGITGALAIDRTVWFMKRQTFRDSGLPLIYIAVVVILAGTAWRAATYVKKLRVEMRPYLQEAIVDFQKIKKDKLPVMSYWSYGYVIQEYLDSPTYLDGLLESPKVHERLVKMSQLLFQKDEQTFYDFCKEYKMEYFFVDKWYTRTQLYALYAEYPYGRYFKAKGEPTDFGKDTIRSRLIYFPQTLKKFKLIYKNQRFNIYKIL